MSIMDGLFRKMKYGRNEPVEELECEYCTHCDANLTLQKGYDPDAPYWTCLGCGRTLINPNSGMGDVVWICDGCGECLNVQEGFTEKEGFWKCTGCGFVNGMAGSEIYPSAEDYERAIGSPYAGLSDEDLLELLVYDDEGPLAGHDDVILMRRREDGARFVKKLTSLYDRSVFEFLRDHPLPHVPKVVSLHEGRNCLVEVEENVEGETLESILQSGPLPEGKAVSIALGICEALKGLHGLETPIIHRDIKPSNVIIGPDGEVFLVDVNVAKWYSPDKSDDTRYLGTPDYAAPEQAGFGMESSSPKADIYGLVILMNVMVTGCVPKQRKASGKIWEIIERCVKMDPGDRPDAWELSDILRKNAGGSNA